MYLNQRTLSKKINCFGIGLHSGKRINLVIKPASINYGIKFIRKDIYGSPEIKANFNNIVDTKLSTAIGNERFRIFTIEHLMSTFAGLFIDNAIVEIDGSEVPIMDGSAKFFVDLIYNSGIKEQNAYKSFFLIKKPISFLDKDKYIIMYPSNKYRIFSTIDYNHSLIRNQNFLFDSSINSFAKELAIARTFAFYKDIKIMKKNNLALGGSLNNAIVLNKNSIFNESGLRFNNEFIRHKVLDFIGDFSLIGFPILADIIIFKSGHTFNFNFLNKLFKMKSFWDIRPLEKIKI